MFCYRNNINSCIILSDPNVSPEIHIVQERGEEESQTRRVGDSSCCNATALNRAAAALLPGEACGSAESPIEERLAGWPGWENSDATRIGLLALKTASCWSCAMLDGGRGRGGVR